MSTKVIYFLVDDRPEQAEFRSDFPADDIKGKLGSVTRVTMFPGGGSAVGLRRAFV